MRQIDREFNRAFRGKTPLQKSNTRCDGNRVWLHNNLIIERRGHELWASLAGWDTPITRRRLSGVLEGHLQVWTKKGKTFARTSEGLFEIEPDEWFPVYRNR